MISKALTIAAVTSLASVASASGAINWTFADGFLNLGGDDGAAFITGLGGSTNGDQFLTPVFKSPALGDQASALLVYDGVGFEGAFASLEDASSVVDFTGQFVPSEDLTLLVSYDFTGLDPKKTAAGFSLFDTQSLGLVFDASLGFGEVPTSFEIHLQAGTTYTLEFSGTITDSTEGSASASLQVVDPIVGLGDLDGNGSVDIDDLLQVLGAFGVSDAGDLDGDLDTDIDDLLLVLGLFGTQY